MQPFDKRRVSGFHLRKAGATGEEAGNGLVACELVLGAQGDASLAYDVVLMDMQMPVLDGYSAARRLRSEGVALPIIALTAHALAEERRRCMDAGMDGFITKPFSFEQLAAELRLGALGGTTVGRA